MFGHAIQLRYAGGAITFDPLRQGAAHVELPITWTRWTDDARAELRISGRLDPLHLVFYGEDDEDAAVEGWVLALVAYAQLVCREDLAEFVRPRSHSTTARVRSAPTTDRPRVAAGPRGARVSGGFRPIVRTRRWIASYVAGHRRRLRPGHHASTEAKARAARVGITLRPGETWVSPHVRGVPADAVLQFDWDAPAEFDVGAAQR